MIETLLNKRIEVHSLVRTDDGQGGWTESYQDSGVILSGRVRPRSASEREMAGSEYSEISHVVYTLSPPKRGNRLVIDDLTLEVIAVRNPSLMGHHYEIDCKEIQAGTSLTGS